MPVKHRTIGAPPPGAPVALVEELTAELKGGREFGQPVVEVDTYQRTNVVLVTVIWDKFGPLSDGQRSAVIVDAYTRAFGPPGPDNTVFAVGWTMDEAVDAGKFPFMIVPLLRASDPVDRGQIRDVAIEFGGTPTPGSDFPAVLRFTTREDAEICRAKLVERLPGSDPIWTITQEARRPEWAG
jgi:hypothetical protein